MYKLIEIKDKFFFSNDKYLIAAYGNNFDIYNIKDNNCKLIKHNIISNKMDIPLSNIIGNIDENLLIGIGLDLKINIYEIKDGKILYFNKFSIQNNHPGSLLKLKNNKFLFFNAEYNYLNIKEELKKNK